MIATAALLDIGGLAADLSTLLGITTESAGWLLGGVLSGVLIVVGLILASKLGSTSPVPLFFLCALGFGLSTLFGWFPIWMIFTTVIFALLSILGMFRSASP